MGTIDLMPLYRNTVSLDRLASLLGNSIRTENNTSNYPPYDIETLDDHRYTIRLAVAGFKQEELDIQIERGMLTVKGKKKEDESNRNFLYRGIVMRAFERKFNLMDHIEVTSAQLDNGLLTIELKHEIPETMRPKRVEINTDESTNVIEHKSGTDE